MLELQMRLAGVVAIVLGLAHLALPRLLGWPADLVAVSPMSRLVVGLHTGFVGLTCVVLGALLWPVDELLAPGALAATVLAAQTVFWGARWLCELVVVGRVVRAAPLAWRAAHVVGLGGWAWLTAVPLTALLTR
ncbi:MULTISPECIES: hypothetical protein [Amycolatopsis]|uniref:Uncharacterized protein n=1 Tax=Amycolatopsis thermoflava TaxID=84480 RepID=A0A3N2GS97_9PSEU|nr:hypothetical protein [Amycolatopsis thermoflava]ROS39099.1 hypothetical protein EDD35_1392 [Amycolatopsis thermoflava]